jgi:hypothetical protein
VRNFYPTFKAARPKHKLFTRKHLHKFRTQQAAERAEELKAERERNRIPRKWKDHTIEMSKMTAGCRG